MKFASRYADIFLANDLVMLMNRYLACLSVEIPANARLKRSGDHRLWWSKFDQLSIQIDPCPARNCVFVDGHKVRVGDHAVSVHFELEKFFPVDVLRPIDPIQNRQTNLAIGVQFGVGDTNTLANVLCHIVSPAGSICSRNQGSSQYFCRRYEQEHRQRGQMRRAQRSRPTKAVESA